MQAVNFLSKLNSNLSKQQEKDRKIFRVVLIFFILALIVFLASIGSTFYLQYKLKSVKKQTAEVKNKIDSQKQLEANYIFFVNKLSIIKTLFDQRADKQIALGYFAELFGPNITISGLNYDMEEGILSLTVTSPNVFELEKALAVLQQPDVTKNFKSLYKTNLTRTLLGQYKFDLTLSFKEDSDLIDENKEY